MASELRTEGTSVDKKRSADDIVISTASNSDNRVTDIGNGATSKLERNFNVWSLLFMSFCTSVTWEAVSSAAAQALTSGGSSSFVWGFAASAVGALAVGLCISEYSSMIPTAGGQHHYVAELAPAKYRRVLSWYTGWVTIFGWIFCATAGIFATAMQIQSWAILFSEGYVYERWHTSLIVIGLATFYTVFSIFEIKRLHYMMFIAMFCHVVGYFATAIYLLVHVNPKNTAQYVFADFTNLSGWESPGIAWSIGLMSSAIGFVGWDSSAHLAEEMVNVSRDLPRTMIANIGISGLLTFPWVIAVAFCMTDIQGMVTGPVGTISPFAQLYYNVSGGSQAVTIGMTCILPVMGFLGTGASVISATSRIIWSFARDGALPRSLAGVDDRQKVPVRALIVTCVTISALSLTYIGNSTAYYGISSACTVMLLISYGIPTLINSLWGFKNCSVPRGVFTLGRWHRPVAIFASAWVGYLVIFFCFPTTLPITAATMNYAVVFLAFWIVVATATWFMYGKTKFHGLPSEIIDELN
uniref:Amino acid permease/ SLC12A domain-containing protein n=1 Tax=Bionectria ochroleuca TaxID=29856 RepID=A0A0B7KFZ8_BIOOC